MTTKSHSLRTADLLSICLRTNEKHARSRYIFTKGNFNCCAECCSVFRERFALNDLWEVKADCINKSDRFLYCDSCETRIPIAKRSK